uniref:Bassoon presynaptic cytomatrix protein n=1 Tax=Cyprinus carpio TaxID=7962 RepID=A0A8C1PUQ5_CYPCA
IVLLQSLNFKSGDGKIGIVLLIKCGPGGDFGMGGIQASGNPYKKPVHDGPRHSQTSSTHQSQIQASSGGMGHTQSPGQHASRRNLQVDFSSSSGRTGRSPSVSPDRASAPSSPYSVPQIAPMPSSKLCPVCNTTELTNFDGSPNFNKCTQCHTTVCNQCGFNPNPHLAGVKEWLCLNCQMQRALGMDMTTPRSKSQQQIHSPSHQPKADPIPKTQPSAQPTPQLQTQNQTQMKRAVPLPGLAKAQSQSDLGRSSPVRFGGQPDKTRSAGSSPAHHPTSHEAPQDGLTKLFGFGASLLNQASTLISVDPLPGSSPHPSPARNQSAQGTKVIFSDANAGASAKTTAGPPSTAKTGPGGVTFPKGPGAPLQKQPLQQQLPVHHQKGQKPEVTCPLCKTAFNVGTTEPPNYRSCTQCHTEVCNLCGFNPTPHLVEKKEWLCLNCQTQRLMSGGLDPLPVLPSSPSRQPTGSPRHQQLSSKQQQGLQTMSSQQKPPVSQQGGFSSPIARPASDIKTFTQPTTAATPPTDNKSTQKRGTTESVQTPSKDEKKELQSITKYYEVSHVFFVFVFFRDAPIPILVSKTNSNHDLSRSPQSLSDTGYSSDGISSSHSEITGVIQEEELKMSERGLTGHHTPPSPSELIKLESSMRTLLESKFSSEGERTQDKKRGKQQHGDIRKHQSRSISISPEEYDSDEDFECIMEEEEDPTEEELRAIAALGDNSSHKKINLEPEEITDEEFMRRQIMEMSADEENEDEDEEEEMEEEDDDEDEGYGYKKLKTQKHLSDSGKEKRRLTYHSSSFEEDSKTTSDVYKGSAEEDLMASQGGLRRFKTIELNNTNSYSRDMELNNDNDLSLDREPELEMESLTGSPEERSRGDYSSTLQPTTSSYTSGISPTSISSMEDDSDSSPSRRQRLEEAKQQRKARHRSHGPLLPTIEDSSEEDELREEEELLKEQEKMREVEQQRIRSTVRKTKRDKEELRAQRRRERSKTPPSNLSPIEDASPTEELRQAAEMEELHRSSCSEYSPSADSDAEGYEISSKLYKSGSEYNLPTFMSLYSPTEKPQTTSSTAAITTPSSGKQLKSAEEVYEEMMRKAEMLQKQQKQQTQQQSGSGLILQQYSTPTYQESDIRNRQDIEDDYDYPDQDDLQYENEETVDIYEEIRQTSQNISKQLDDQMEMDVSYSEKQLLDTGSAFAKLLEQSNALLTPGTSPTQLSAPVSFSETGTGGRIPDVRVTQHFSKDGPKDRLRNQTGKNGITPTVAATTIAAYGVYARDTVTVSQTSASQTVSTTQPNLYGRQTTTTSAGVSDASHKIAAITQAYNQRESAARKMAISKGVQMRDNSTSSETITESGPSSIRCYNYHERSPPLSPTSSPLHSPTRSPSRRTAELSTQTVSPSMLASSGNASHTSLVMAQGTQTSHGVVSPSLYRQQSSQDTYFIVRTEELEPTSPPKPVTVNTATSPLSSPTRFSRQSTFDAYSPPVSPPDTPPHQLSPQHGFYKNYRAEKVNVGTSMVSTASMYTRGSLSMENISLCRISTVPGTSRIEQGQRLQSGSVVDLRTGIKPTPVVMTDHGMDLTSLATESRKYSGSVEGSPIRQSTTIQPIIMNLNTQEQLHVVTSTATTVSVTVTSSMFMSQPKHPVLYCDPLENRFDLGKDMGTVVCLAPNKPPPVDPSIPKIDAKLEDLTASFAKLNLSSQLPLFKKDMLVTQKSTATEVNVISPGMTSEVYSFGGPLELRGRQAETSIMNLTNVKPQGMMVQIDGTAQGATITQLIKPEEGQDAMILTGQIKSENQVTCCDMVYNLPFGGSCVGGPFSQKPVTDETSKPSSRAPSSQPQLYQQHGLRQDGQTYQDYTIKSYTLPFPGRLQPSMSETNLAEAGLSSYSANIDPQFHASRELFTDTVKDGYDGGYFGMGLQYGSYTDLRQGDVADLPIRRYSSLTNMSSDYGYFSGDFAESNLAQYSATTAREISRMCAALNSIDRYSSNPDILQLGTGRSSGPSSRISLPQSHRPGFKYSPDGKPLSHSQALTDLINARQASLRAMYPSAIRSADGMIYSTINTPIASTVPITTQPAPVLRPLLKGVYRPYPTPNMTPIPLASLTRLPLDPRTGQAPFQCSTPNPLPVTTSTKVPESPAITTVQDAPLYLGKSPVSLTVAGTVTQPFQPSSGHPVASKTQPPPSSQGGRTTAAAIRSIAPSQEKETEERLHQQQEQLLQLERERVELEKLRQLRLQEELERERAELQRHREKEQMLVQREIQELQTIKQQVLQQQQVERESQLVLQREQLAQQKHQLDQIQSLQQQLQQQLEEQKRQKTATAITNTQILSDQSGRIIQPQELASDMLYSDVQVFLRPLPNSTSEICLRNSEDQTEIRSMRKQRSMPRLQDGNYEEMTMFSLPQRLVDCSVQTDDEDGEERYLVSRRRRTRRSVDCSVQTDDDEDKAEWEQPVRRRRSRYTRHSGESGVEHKSEAPAFTTSAAKATSSSIAIQTIRDCSCQTETEQLVRVSPSIHVTIPDPSRVEIVHYISGPERTQKGQSLACQTDPETQSQSTVIPQISIATTVSPTSVQLVGSADPLSPGQQSAVKFGRRRPDPLEFGYQQHHLHNESLSSLIRQQPKSPQVLYSPVSPLSSPQRIIETAFSSSERLNKAHVTPQQKSCIAEPSQRHQALPRPMKNIQRSMSDPKPLSPTTDENTKARISLYQQQALQSQLAALQQSSLLRKVKRTLPSPPPEETHLPMVTPNLSHMLVPSLPSLKGGSRLAAKASLLKDLTHELKAVEQESTKLRKQQAELEEEEKEIDAKLRYLELGITQRKETLAKERDRRELAYLRCMSDSRDYMSDSELNNLRLTAFTCELNTAAQFPPTSSFITGFNQPPYPSVTQAQALPQPTPLQTYPTISYQVQGPFPSQFFPQNQPPYPADTSVPPPAQPSQPGFQPTLPPTGPVPYPTHSTPYPSQAPPYPVSQASTYQPQTDTLTFHQKPRQTLLADLEHKMPTNYEVLSNPTVVATTTAQDITNSQSGLASGYGPYTTISSSSLYGSSGLEQNVPRNYVMIDDICELTKEGMTTSSDSHRNEGHGRYGSDGLHTRGGSSFGRPEDERDADLYDQHHSRGKSTCNYQAQGAHTHGRVVGSSSMGGGSSYYYDDCSHSIPTLAAQRHSSKNQCPSAVVSSRRSKHRKQGTEQKISKFSPIEEAHDVEADLASYTMSTSTTSGYGSGSHYHKLQDGIYGLRSTYSPQRGYYNDEHLYGYGRSRSAGYGMDKISPCERAYRSRSYERDHIDRSYCSNYGHSVRPALHSQYSEKENSHLMTKLMGVGRAFGYSSNSYGSSHSLPDVQDHIRDLPRTHVYKPDDMYIIDDMHCAVSDSEAYHLGQEETDWFEKPRDVRGSRHYGSSGHSGRRGHVKHTYHDSDEPPEDLWPQDDYGHTRHISSREHRHHSSGSSGRHSSRHSDEPRSSRSSRSSKDPSMRHDSRSLSSSGRRGESRSQGYHSSDYSRDTSGHHHSSRSGKQSSHHQGSSSRKQQDHPSSSRQPGSLGPGQKGPSGPSSSGRQAVSQPPVDGQQGQRTQLQQQAQTSAARPGSQTSATGTTQPQLVQAQQLQAKPGQTGPTSRQPTSAAQTSPAVVSSKAAPRPGGIGSAAPGQPGVDGESMLSKILPGGAAEQAGKLGEAISGFGKKFSSLW